MSKWERVNLDNICVKKIQTISSIDDFNIEYVDISSIDNQEKKIILYQTIRTKEAPSRAKQILKKEDILVSTVRPNLNAVAINRIESENVVVGSTGFCVLRCNDKIDVNYVFNYCKSKAFINELVKVAKGASYPAVSNSEVRNSKIPLPPLETQKQISKTLDTAAELLAMRKQQIAELDNLIKSTFCEMFGNENEFDKWDCTTIENVAKVTVGVVIKPAQYYTQESNGVKTFRSLNVGEMCVRDKSWIYFTPEGNKTHNKSILKTGDILVVRSGYPGTSCVVTEEYAGCNAVDIIIARPNVMKINPLYLCAFTNFPHGKNQVVVRTSGAAQQHFNVGAYKAMTIPLPPLELQNKFACLATKIEEQKTLVKKAIDETQYLFDSLMSEYFE